MSRIACNRLRTAAPRILSFSNSWSCNGGKRPSPHPLKSTHHSSRAPPALAANYSASMVEFRISCCYFGFLMASKTAKRTKAVIQAAALLEEHFASLPPAEEKKARKELHQLASTVSRRARGTASRSGRSARSRPALRSSARKS